MITIPRYEEQVKMSTESPGVPGPLENEDAAGERARAPYRNIAAQDLVQAEQSKEMASAWNSLAETSIAAERHLSHARALNDFNEMNLQARLKLNDASNEVQQDRENPQIWRPQYEEKAKAIQEEILGMSTNSEAQEALKRSWSTLYPTHVQELHAQSRKQEALNFEANADRRFGEYVDLGAQARDDLSRTQIKDEFYQSLNNAVAVGTINPVKAETMRQNYDMQVKERVYATALTQDPVGTLATLKQNPGAFGFNEKEALTHINGATPFLHKVQNDNYTAVMQNILGATADSPVPGAVMPTEAETLAQMNRGELNIEGAGNILAYIRGQKSNPENKYDPESYKVAVTRLTDPDNPLTREEFLKNVESGEWKFDAKTYGTFLSNINSRGTKLDKAQDSAFKGELAFQKTQFNDPYGIGKEFYQTAVGQAQLAKENGELGNTSEEIKTNMKDIFNNQMKAYQVELNLGKTKPPPKTGIISRIGGWLGGGDQSPPAAADQKKYRDELTKRGISFR
jgi:hypothetical protein